MLVLRIGEQEYALAVDAVREVIEAPPVTQVPMAPRAVAGVAAVRGEIIPVLDLGVRLHGRRTETARRIVVVETPGEGRVALLADDVVGMIQAQSEEAIGPVPADGPQDLAPGLAAGLYPHAEDRVIVVLRLDRVLTLDETEEER